MNIVKVIFCDVIGCSKFFKILIVLIKKSVKFSISPSRSYWAANHSKLATYPSFVLLPLSISVPVSEVYSEPCQTFKIERFLKIKNGWKPFTIFPKRYILHFWQGSEYASILRFLMLCKILLHLQILITTAMLNFRRMAII